MPNIVHLYRLNASTFYNFRTKKRHSLFWRYLALTLISLLAALTYGERSDNVYIGIITAQSILVGFGFNVLFYLSSNEVVNYDETFSIEDASRVRRLRTVSEEVFYNIGYFNIVALASVVLCLIVLVSQSYAPLMSEAISKALGTTQKRVELWGVFEKTLLRLVLFLVYFCVAESLLTFVRTVQRVSFLFESKMKLRADQTRDNAAFLASDDEVN
jgi:hypothetical protein